MLAGLLAREYGVPRKWIDRIGVDNFQGMSEELRRLVLGCSKHASLCRAGKAEPWTRFPGRAIRRSIAGPVSELRGRETADWMEEFSRSDMTWFVERPDLGIANNRNESHWRKALELVRVIGGGEEIYMAPTAVMGAEMIGHGAKKLPGTVVKSRRVERMMELAGMAG